MLAQAADADYASAESDFGCLHMEDDKNPVKAKAARARAKALLPRRRSEIARKAAQVRWGAKATHKGNFRDELGIDVDCYVLDDEIKSAVISQRGMAAALGFKEGGGLRFRRFLEGKSIGQYLGAELREKVDNPVKFQSPGMGPDNQAIVFGYDVTVLIDVCKAIAIADKEDALRSHQKPIAKQAAIILGASAKLGIQHLVYSLSGYDPTREETIAAFKMYVAEEARDYEREFPEQLYLEWYRLYGLPVPEKGSPWKFRHLTVDHVYYPLAKSRGRILELTRVQKFKADDRRKKLHQFLSDVGVKALRQHLGQLLGAAQLADTRVDYEKNVRRLFGAQHEMNVTISQSSTAPPPPSEQSPPSAPPSGS